eukprot:4333042-Prymnesium_polylepis.1
MARRTPCSTEPRSIGMRRGQNWLGVSTDRTSLCLQLRMLRKPMTQVKPANHQPRQLAPPAPRRSPCPLPLSGEQAAEEALEPEKEKAKAMPPAAVVNRVTGGNAPKLEKKHCVRDAKVLADATALRAKGVDELIVNQLHFAVSPQPDGEFSVGLVRIDKVHKSDMFDLSWWQRSDDKKDK